MSVCPAQASPAASRTPAPRFARAEGFLLIVGLAVLVFQAWSAAPARSDWGNTNARGSYYNLLVDGLSAGQLHLPVDVPRGLLELPDPYDPHANALYRTRHHLHDSSLYREKVYLYYGITPALVLFGPYHWLTSGYLFNKQAAFVFAAIGYAAGMLLLRSMWRRYFTTAPAWAVAACAGAFGVTTSIPALLRIPGICEVAIAAAHAFVMLSCLGVWHALHAERRRELWLGLASAAYGLAVGARPSVLFGAVILLVPAVLAWRRARTGGAWRQLQRAAAAAVLPIFAIGIGLALYNYARFGDVFEFGQRYQLAGDRQDTARHFSLAYLWFNFRLYFLQPAAWLPVFPFVQETVPPPAPVGHAAVESAHGIFANTPFALLAFGVIAAWRDGRAPELRGFLAGLAALFGTSAVLLCLFYGTVLRYQAEFQPTLILIACVGVLALEHHCRHVIRRVSRGFWLAALAWSMAFGVLTNIGLFAAELNKQAVLLAADGRRAEAKAKLDASLRINRALAPAHSNLGILYLDEGNPQAAATHFGKALEFSGSSLDALIGYGRALAALARLPEAAEQFTRALKIDPDSAPAHFYLATIQVHLGQFADAVPHYRRAIGLGLNTPEVRQALEQAEARAQLGSNQVAPP